MFTTPIAFSNVYVWLGMALFGINFMADKFANLPMAEIALTGFMAVAWAQQPKGAFNNLPLRSPQLFAVLLCFLLPLLSLVVIGDLYKGYDGLTLFRDSLKMALMILPFLLYLALGRKETALQLLVGFVLGYGFFFLGYAALELAQGNISRELRNLTPSPSLMLLLGLFGRNVLSRTVRTTCFVLGVVGVLVAISIEVRGAMLGVVLGSTMGFGAWLMHLTHFPLRRAILIAIFLFIPFVPWVLVVAYDGFAWLDQYYSTYSNLERAALIQFAHARMAEFPWLGYDMAQFRLFFIDAFEGLSGWDNPNNKAPDSPHSFYVDMGLIFGLPVLGLCLLFWGWLYNLMMRSAGRGFAAAAFGIAIITVHLAFFGYTDVRRLEILAIVAFLMFAVHQRQNPVPQVTT